MVKSDLGHFLREARIEKGLSQGDVAQHLKLHSPQSVSDWERGYGSGVPIKSLKRLVKLYDLDCDEVFDLLLDYQFGRLQKSLEKEFFKPSSRREGTQTRIKKPREC